MLPLGRFILDALVAGACAVSLMVFARAVQLRFLGSLSGAELVTARAIAGFSMAVGISYVLGAIGAFALVPLAVAFLATGPVAQLTLKPLSSGERATSTSSPAELIPLLIGFTLLLAVWLAPIANAMRNGMTGTDALWYHMPFALRFYQDHSLGSIAWNEPLFQTYFYPSSGSLFHALGMVFFQRDFVSPLVNLGWLLLLVVAGAAIGSRRGVGAAAALGAGSVFAGDKVLDGSAGSAMVDTPATFFFLAGVSMLLRARESRAALILCGLAMGVGVSIKLTIAIPAAGTALALLILLPRGVKWRGLLTWGLAALSTSWFWFARNIAETGNPIPMVDIPFLSGPGKALESSNMVPVAKYFTNPDVMLHRLPSAWLHSLGPLALVAIALGVAASIALVARPPDPIWRAAGIVSLVATAGYFFTPGTAAGPPGGPILGLIWDTRFIAPGLCLGLALLPVWVASVRPAARTWLPSAMAVFVAVPAITSKSWNLPDGLLWLLLALALTAVALMAMRSGARPTGARAAVAIGLLAVGLLAGGRAWETRAVEGRALAYAPSSPGPGAKRIAVIGVAGTFSQYLESDVGLHSRIQFVGMRGPNGAFSVIGSCPLLLRTLNAGHYNYVIASPNRRIWRHTTVVNPQVAWVSADPNSALVKTIPGLKLNYPLTGPRRPERFPVFRLSGQLDPSRCPR